MTAEQAMRRLGLASSTVRLVARDMPCHYNSEGELGNAQCEVLGIPKEQDSLSEKRGGWCCIDRFDSASEASVFCRQWGLTIEWKK